jgi:hypothetical protein
MATRAKPLVKGFGFGILVSAISLGIIDAIFYLRLSAHERSSMKPAPSTASQNSAHPYKPKHARSRNQFQRLQCPRGYAHLESAITCSNSTTAGLRHLWPLRR